MDDDDNDEDDGDCVLIDSNNGFRSELVVCSCLIRSVNRSTYWRETTLPCPSEMPTTIRFVSTGLSLVTCLSYTYVAFSWSLICDLCPVELVGSNKGDEEAGQR